MVGKLFCVEIASLPHGPVKIKISHKTEETFHSLQHKHALIHHFGGSVSTQAALKASYLPWPLFCNPRTLAHALPEPPFLQASVECSRSAETDSTDSNRARPAAPTCTSAHEDSRP